jgi:hypothetical protein
MASSKGSENPVTEAKTNREKDSKVETKIQYRVLRLIVFRRKNIDLFSKNDRYGHWWVEIYKSPFYSMFNLQESYGWWPFVDEDRDGRGDIIGLWQTLRGIPGKLNDGYNNEYDPKARPNAVTTQADDSFHPMIKDERTEVQVIDEIRKFASRYDSRGKIWAWPAFFSSSRSNCRVFQEEMISELNLYRSRVPISSTCPPEVPTLEEHPAKKSK